VAAGWYAREFDAVGVPFKQRGRLFERNFEILTRLWTEDRVTLQADEFNLREAVMRPKTVQRPRPPILIGGYVDAVLKRVATKGDGWLTYFYTPESYTKSWSKIVAFAREAGRDPKTLTGTNQLAVLVGKSRAETEAPMRHWLQTEWDVAAWSESTIEHAIRGSVKECIEQLSAHVASGVDRLILIPYRYRPEQVELIAREILPALG
jgi:alkanesulfonate monooxygenase